MENLTEKQREQIAIEEFRKQPTQNICIVAIVKLAEIAISTDAESATFDTTATVNNKRYKINAVITYEEV